jgi:hypothetical protein
MLVITPWIVRNKLIVGEFYLNRPINYLNRIQSSKIEAAGGRAHVYSPTAFSNRQMNRISLQPAPIPGTKIRTSENHSRPNLNPLRGIPWHDVLDHYVNQLTQSVVYLPSYPMILNLDYLSKGLIGKWQEYYGGAIYSPTSYVKKLPYWWIQWEGEISPASMIFVAVNCLMIAWGVYGSWKKSSWKAGVPAASYFAFITPYALIRLSGGRRIQPVDWISVVYYSVGLIEISRLLIKLWRGNSLRPERDEISPQLSSSVPALNTKTFSAVFVCLMLAGLTFPAAEVFAENQYASPTPEDVYRQMHAESTSPFSQKEAHLVQEFLDQGGDLLVGEAFYPRQFYPGESLGDVRGNVIGFMERGHLPRTEFYLSGSDIAWGVLVREDAPEDFPHGTKVLAVGCMERGVMDTLAAVLLPRSQGEEVKVYWRDEIPWESLGCPFREAQ